MLMVSDGAGILGERVKLAFASGPRSPPPRLFASFSPPLFAPVLPSPAFPSDGALVSVPLP